MNASDITEINMTALNALKNYAMEEKNYPLLLRCYEELLRREPDRKSFLNNCMYSSVMSYNWDKAIDYAFRNLKNEEYYLNSLDALSHTYYYKRDYDNCSKYGTEALEIREKEALKDGKLPKLPQIKPRKGKKIIAFSLFGGSNHKYIEGAVLNAELVSQIYPGWICRFYIDDSIPESAVERLKNYGAEVILCDESVAHIPKTMWRFFTLDDESVSYVIFRDTDSVISPREAKAVAEWIDSGKYFNTLRDNGSNTDLIMAGLWGAMCGVIPNVREMIEDFVAKGDLDKRFADQHFLKFYLWTYMVQSIYAVDNLFKFCNPHPFQGSRFVDNFVGKVETAAKVEMKVSWKDGTKLKWKLYSRINPFIDETDNNISLLKEERFICEYETECKFGKVVIKHLPLRYVKLNMAYSRIELEEVK